MRQPMRVILNGNVFAKHKLSKFDRVFPTRDTIWPWIHCHGFLPREPCEDTVFGQPQ